MTLLVRFHNRSDFTYHSSYARSTTANRSEIRAVLEEIACLALVCAFVPEVLPTLHFPRQVLVHPAFL